MTTLMTPERFQARWNNYKKEPQQSTGIWLLYEQIKRGDSPEQILSETADWAKKFSETPQKIISNPLDVIYYSQLDNYTDPHGTCYSSACAMMLKYLKPSAIANDDAYLARVLSFGKSTDPNSQISALKTYGIEAALVKNMNKQKVISYLRKAIPVPCGFLHHGTSAAPRGGGHWLTWIGDYDKGLIVHDPYGEMNVSQGTYGSKNGAFLKYSYTNWLPRWEVEGPNTGWSIIVKSIDGVAVTV